MTFHGPTERFALAEISFTAPMEHCAFLLHVQESIC